jgi:N-acetylglutamate synthase-like GNAT family acetyltransferase
MNIDKATKQDRPDIEALLSRAKLPTADLFDEMLKDFLVFREGEFLIGAVGLQRSGSSALLRSLVVKPEAQGKGVAIKMLAAIESHARSLKLHELHLLTTDAKDYFERHGYVVCDRSEAPQEIRSTAQFSGLCPASSTFMSKRLG